MPSRLPLFTIACLLSVPALASPHHDEHKPPRPALMSVLPAAREMPNAAAGLAKPYGGTPIDVLTYHYDNNRTGWNPSETDLTAATITSGKFGLLKTLNVDGNVFAQPLLVTNFVMPNGATHDVLVIATGHNSVYAYDAKNYALLWHAHLGQPQLTQDVGCYDVMPEYGISGTPVIVRNTANVATIYLIAATEPHPFEFHSFLHAISLATGKDAMPPVEVSPSATLSDGSTLAFDPQNQWNRPGLAISGSSIYIGIGSHCDNNSGAISGWLLQYGTDLSLKNAFHTIETPGGTELASIWMSGFAPAIDAQGNIFVVTGNGDLTSTVQKDWGESVLRLPPDVSGVASRFSPISFHKLNYLDLDFGSGGVMLVPGQKGQVGPQLAVASGKEAVLYLLDQQNLGGLSAGNAGALQSIKIASLGSGVRGGPAYFDGPKGGTVYLQTDGDFLRSFSVITGNSPALVPGPISTSYAAYGGSLPIISSNGAAPGTGGCI